jgi:cytochrome o ubiquinol oxidase subunit 1
MTAIETETESHGADAVNSDASGDALYEVLASNDHKMVGRRFILASLGMLVGVGIVGIMSEFERSSLGGFSVLGDIATYIQTFAFVRAGGVLLVAMPLFIGIALATVPLQVGAPAVAFPRLAAASFWAWLVGAGIFIASFLADGGFGPGEGTANDATLLTITSTGMIIAALLAACVCIATTVIALRPAGMTLMRVPMFSWSMLVATTVWLLSMPVLMGNLVLIYADLQGRAPIAFGRPATIWSQVEWAFQAPQILAFAIPVLGVAADVLPVSAKVRQGQRAVVQTLIGLFGAVSFGAWAQHAFSRGVDPAFTNGNLIYEEALYFFFALAAFAVALAAFGGILDNFRRGSMPKISMALVGSVTGLLLLLVGAAVGLIRVLPFLDVLHDEQVLLSSTGSQYKFLLAAVVASAIGAIAWWSPNIFGGYAVEGLGLLAVLTVLLFAVLSGLSDLITAFLGQADISVSSSVDDGVEALNVISSIGMIALTVAGLALLGSAFGAFRSSEVLPDDPWEGHTLEWAAPSPPPVGNFIEPINVIESPEPLLDELEEVS